mmetsp:Transcript_7727/g.20842  ORF Transcript_7727/g.20842 Transcript_7727/m.20842 type:complete len:267 (+) Transcript_7727:68-868(+)
MGPGAAMLRTALLALGLAVNGAAGASVDLENGVLVLQDSNFATALEKFPNLMVKFYAPWCGHCKAMAPEYEKAARNLKKRTPAPARLAKVDATTERTIAKKYDVKGYPTILIFKNGEIFDTYGSGRDKQDFVDYMLTLDMPAPGGTAMRGYYAARGMFKEVLKMTPLPQKYYKYAGPALLVAMTMPLITIVWIFSLVFGAVFGGRKPPAPAAKKAAAKEAARGRGAEAGGKATRSASPGAREAKAAEKDEAEDNAAAKDEDEKKGD